MKLKNGIIVTMLCVLLLSGCKTNKYTDTGDTLNGNKIYTYDSEQEVCAKWYSMGVDIGDGIIFNIMNECPLNIVVLFNGEYVTLFNYLTNNEIDITELENIKYGFFTDSASILNILEIDLNDYELESIIVKELNNEIMTPPEWNSSEMIDLEMSDISQDILTILNEPLGERNVCESGNFCGAITYAQGPINIRFVNGEKVVFIELYDNRLNLRIYMEDKLESTIYFITDPFDSINGLYNTIYNRYLEINE